LRSDRLAAAYIECKVNWPWSSGGLTWTEQEANDSVFLPLGWMAYFFSFHFGYILHDRFWRNHINSLWLFISVKHASFLVENTLLFIHKFICPFLCVSLWWNFVVSLSSCFFPDVSDVSIESYKFWIGNLPWGSVILILN